MSDEIKTPATDSVNSIDRLCVELEKMHKRLIAKKIPYYRCASWEQEGREGWNDGLTCATKDIKRTIARIKKTHNDIVSGGALKD